MTTTTGVTAADNSVIIQNYIDQQKEAAAASTASSSTSTSISSITGDFNTFLKVLTAQLQNQDPLNATDTNQFTQELVQFAGVEQQINSNSKLDQLISLSKGNGITPLLSYVGKYVETAANGQLVVQNSQAAFSYSLPSAANSVAITVTDSSGNTVATMDGTTASGVNRVVWDGKKTDGTTADDGVYKLKIAAVDINDKAIEVSDTKLIGLVTSLQTASDGTTTLSLGSVAVNASAVTAVYSGGSSST